MIEPISQSETGKTQLRPGMDVPHASEARFQREVHTAVPQVSNSRKRVGEGRERPCFPDNTKCQVIHPLPIGLHNDTTMPENEKGQLLLKGDRQLLYKSTTTLSGISKGETQTYFHTKICKQMFIPVLFLTAPNRKQPTTLSMGKQALVHPYHRLLSETKAEKVQWTHTTWINVQAIKQKQKEPVPKRHIQCVIMLMEHF